MDKVIFVKTIYDGDGELRVVPLPLQKDIYDDDVHTTLYISTDKNSRIRYSAGSIFYVPALKPIHKKGVAGIGIVSHYLGWNIRNDKKDNTLIYLASPDLTLTQNGKHDVHVLEQYLIYAETIISTYPEYSSFSYSDVLKSASMRTGKLLLSGSTTTAANAEGKKRKKVINRIPRKFMTLYEKMEADETYRLPTIEQDGYYVETENWNVLCRNVYKRKNTLIMGPTGSGKTELVMLLHERLGKGLIVHDMSNMTDAQTSMLGSHRFVNGQSIFDPAPYALSVQSGKRILIDELSRGNKEATNILLPQLDSRRVLELSIAGSTDVRTIPVHEDCGFFFTANIGGEYTGTTPLDAALMSRLFPVEFSYLDLDNEIKLLMKRKRCSMEAAKIIASVAEQTREMYLSMTCSIAISTRETLEAAELVQDGCNLAIAMRKVFLPRFEGTETSGERSKVIALINRH